MSEIPNQQEVWGAAGRAAALLCSIMLFAVMWESDHKQPEQLAGEVPVPTDELTSAETSSDVETIEIDRTVRRKSGVVRVRLHVQPVSGPNQPELTHELVLHGDVGELRSRLLALLDELEMPGRIVPVSAQTRSTDIEPPGLEDRPTAEGPVPMPRDIDSEQDSHEREHGFIFLSRNPPLPEESAPDTAGGNDSPEPQPRLLNWGALPRHSTRLR